MSRSISNLTGVDKTSEKYVRENYTYTLYRINIKSSLSPHLDSALFVLHKTQTLCNSCATPVVVQLISNMFEFQQLIAQRVKQHHTLCNCSYNSFCCAICLQVYGPLKIMARRHSNATLHKRDVETCRRIQKNKNCKKHREKNERTFSFFFVSRSRSFTTTIT